MHSPRCPCLFIVLLDSGYREKRRGYESKYEEDQIGEELGDDARVWRVLIDEGSKDDARQFQGIRDHLDVDLVFVSLVLAWILHDAQHREVRVVRRGCHDIRGSILPSSAARQCGDQRESSLRNDRHPKGRSEWIIRGRHCRVGAQARNSHGVVARLLGESAVVSQSATWFVRCVPGFYCAGVALCTFPVAHSKLSF